MSVKLIKTSAIGSPKSDIILFVHGAWHGAWCWEKYFTAKFATNGYENYAFDLTKHDKPGKVKGINKVSLNQYVEDLKDAVDQLEQEPIIIAHSMGGFVLQKYLEKYSCKKAVLLAPIPASGVLKTTLNLLFTKRYALPNILILNLLGLVSAPKRARWTLFSETVAESELAEYQEKLSSESLRVFLQMMFPKVKVNFHTKIPMFLLGAGDDNLFTAKEQTKTAKKYGADLKIMPNIAHDMMLDTNHELAANEIIQWLEK